MMSDVIRQETAVFLLSVLHGVGLTLCYDVLRALRRAFAHSLAAISAEDFLFWLAAGFLTFCLAFFRTDGVIRGYVAAGIAIGVILYHFTASAPIVRALAGVFLVIKRVFSAIFGLIARPLKKIAVFGRKRLKLRWKGFTINSKKKLRGIHHEEGKKKAQQ